MLLALLFPLASIVYADIPPAELQNFSATIDVLAGTFDAVNSNDGFATLASIAYTGDGSTPRSMMEIQFSPPEFCQAVKICVTEKVSFEKTKPLKIQSEFCEKNWMTYQPPTGKIEVFFDGNLMFQGFTGELKWKNRNFSYSDGLFWTTKLYETKSAVFGEKLAQKMLVIFTNSRQCHPQVRVDGKASRVDFLLSQNMGNPLPEEFSPIHNGAKIKTFYTNTAVQNSARTIDYFPQLKAHSSIKTAQGQIEFRTSLAGGPSSRISQISVIEVDKKINQNLGAGDLREDKISIDLSDCHWLRLWFVAKADATWQNYNVDFEPANSIDFFLNEGFVMLPDRENAAMLPTSSKISQIHLKSHGNELVELLIGSKSMLHPITFKTPMLNSADFKIFLIRAPKCDAVFRMTPKFTRGNLKIFNNFQLSGAKIYAIQKN